MYKRAYMRLKSEYLEHICDREERIKCNPPKNAFAIDEVENIITKSTNVMSAQTSRGIFTKVISIDDVSGKVSENIIYTDNNLCVYQYSNIGLTDIRCGLMACLAVDLNCEITDKTVIGFIGNGKINRKTCEILNSLFGLKKFVIRGSERNRAKNKEFFESFGDVVVDDTECLEILNKCDAVICCTNSYSRNDMIFSSTLNEPPLIIAQDGGYLLDETFREDRCSYTDHIEQLNEHYDSEFPFDVKRHEIGMMMESRDSTRKKAVYLYGIAFADAITFEELFYEKYKNGGMMK